MRAATQRILCAAPKLFPLKNDFYMQGSCFLLLNYSGGKNRV